MKRIMHTTTALILFFIMAACSTIAPSAEPTQTMIPVDIQLSWVHEYSSSAFHAAVRNGHFAAQGMDVTLSVGGFNEQGYIDPIQEVLDGNADFAMSDGFSLVQARANGLPVVAVASILQRSPLAVISLETSGITRPQDFANHTISVAPGGANTSFNTLLQTQNVDPDTLTIVERTSFGIEPLATNEVDGLVGWIINEGVALQEQGLAAQYVLMSDYGVDTYDFVLFTSEATINDNPELVRGVVTATRNGLEDVISNPAQAVEHTLSYNPELVEDEQLRRLEATIPLMNVPGQPLGGMDARVWEFAQDFMLAQNILSEPIAIEEVYTLEFVADDAN